MEKSLTKMLDGYKAFREKYVYQDHSIMKSLSINGQNPDIMVVSCCDSRVDPALILQCDPGDVFVVRNVANIVPPYEKDTLHHGTSAALELGVCFLNVKHLILLGHSQCSGITTLLNRGKLLNNDFISNWVSILKPDNIDNITVDDYSKLALKQSFHNCMTFPWIIEKVKNKTLLIHLWFFDIKQGLILTYCNKEKIYKPLDSLDINSAISFID